MGATGAAAGTDGAFACLALAGCWQPASAAAASTAVA